MAVVPQRELRNHVADVLRRAESGERLTITVDGRPVAELGPVSGSRAPAAPAQFAAIVLDAPVDATWVTDLIAEREADRAGAPDPWA